jgi:hypothetical protein
MALLKRSVEATGSRERVAADTERPARKSKKAPAVAEDDSEEASEKPAKKTAAKSARAAPSTAASKPRGKTAKSA